MEIRKMYRGLIFTFLALAAHHGTVARVVQQEQQQSSDPSNQLSSFQEVFEASDSAERRVNDMFRFVQDESVSTVDEFSKLQNRLKNVIDQQYKRGIDEIQGWENMPVLSDFRERIGSGFIIARNKLAERVQKAGQQALTSLNNVDQSSLPQAIQNARQSFESNIATPLRNYLRALNGVGVGENNQLTEISKNLPSSITNIKNEISNLRKQIQPSKILERRAVSSLAETLNEDLEGGADDMMNSVQSVGTKMGQRLTNRLRTLPNYLDVGINQGNGLLNSARSIGKQVQQQGYNQIQSLSDIFLGNRRQSDRENEMSSQLNGESTRRSERSNLLSGNSLRTNDRSNNEEIETKVDFETESRQRRSIPEVGNGIASIQMLEGRDVTNLSENLVREGCRQQQQVSGIGNELNQKYGSNLKSTTNTLESVTNPQSFSPTQTFDGRDLGGMMNNERQRVQGQLSEMSEKLTGEGRQQLQQASDLGNQLERNSGFRSSQTSRMRRGIDEQIYGLDSVSDTLDIKNRIDPSNSESILKSGMDVPHSFSTTQISEGRDLGGMMNNERQRAQGQFSEISENLTGEGRQRLQQASDFGNQLVPNSGHRSNQTPNRMRRGMKEQTYGPNLVPTSSNVMNQKDGLRREPTGESGKDVSQLLPSMTQSFKGRDLDKARNDEQRVQEQLSKTNENLTGEARQQQRVSEFENKMVQNSGTVSGVETSLTKRGVDELSTYELKSISDPSDVTSQIDYQNQITNIGKMATGTDNIPKSEIISNGIENTTDIKNLINDIQNVPEVEIIDAKSSNTARSGPL